MDAVIAYIRHTRIQKHISQQALADAMGLSLRRVNRWEKGGEESIRAEALLNAIAFLKIPAEDVVMLFTSADATVEDARQLAHVRVITNDPTVQALRSMNVDQEVVRSVIREQQELIFRLTDYLLPDISSYVNEKNEEEEFDEEVPLLRRMTINKPHDIGDRTQESQAPDEPESEDK